MGCRSAGNNKSQHVSTLFVRKDGEACTTCKARQGMIFYSAWDCKCHARLTLLAGRVYCRTLGDLAPAHTGLTQGDFAGSNGPSPPASGKWKAGEANSKTWVKPRWKYLEYVQRCTKHELREMFLPCSELCNVPGAAFIAPQRPSRREHSK